MFTLTLLLLISCSKVVLSWRRFHNTPVSPQTKERILTTPDVDEAYELYQRSYEPSVLLTGSGRGNDRNKGQNQRKERTKKANFVRSLEEIKEHNLKYRTGESWYRMSVNQFSVMDTEEKRGYLGYLGDIMDPIRSNSTNITLLGGEKGSYPDTMSWRTRGYVTDSVDQGKTCLSCWTFPAVALIEFALKEVTGTLVPLSAQQLLDCTYEEVVDVVGPSHDGCEGGRYQDAWEYVIATQHLTTHTEHPYRAADRKCRYDKYPNKLENHVKLTGYKSVQPDPDGVMGAVQLMPLATAIKAEDELWQYGRGIYDGCLRKHRAPDHAVLITGYGIKFWEIRNSWGRDWGIDGFVKFFRGYSNKKMCFLLDYALYITYQNMKLSQVISETVSAVTSQSTTTTSPKYKVPCSKEEGSDETRAETETQAEVVESTAEVVESTAEEKNKKMPGDEAKQGSDSTVDYKIYPESAYSTDEYEDCNDDPEYRFLCEEWSRLSGDPCNSGFWLIFTKYHCMKSCDKCSDCKDKHSKDKHSNCKSWADAGYCKSDQYQLWMKTQCVKSCGYC